MRAWVRAGVGALLVGIAGRSDKFCIVAKGQRGEGGWRASFVRRTSSTNEEASRVRWSLRREILCRTAKTPGSALSR
jgi:hypothetical protein